MALGDNRIGAMNPWWTEAGWQSADPHLRRLAERNIRLPTPLVAEIDLSKPGLHTLRGPRQVGKSTDLKLLVSRALESGYQPRRVVYLSMDLLEDQPISAMADAVGRAKFRAGAAGPHLILLDEVTAVSGWQTALKSLWDEGVIDRDFVLCTGSSAVDLAGGTAERLPGRRGAGKDHVLFPQSFADFARATDRSVPESPKLTAGDMVGNKGKQLLADSMVFGPKLSQALERYLKFGGLPAAVAEAADGGAEPSPETKSVLWDSLRREVQRKGAGEPALQALLERLLRSLGSKTSWSRLAAEMDLPLGGKRRRPRSGTDYRTMRSYIEFLSVGYFTMVVYFWKPDSQSGSISKDKKVYFGDPLLHTIACDLAPGLVPDLPAQVENAVALSLYRRYEPPERQMEGLLAPANLHVWQTASGGEVDFVCRGRKELDAVEVRYRARIDRRTIAGIAKSLPSSPVVVVGKDQLEHTPGLALIPAGLFLWALG